MVKIFALKVWSASEYKEFGASEFKRGIAKGIAAALEEKKRFGASEFQRGLVEYMKKAPPRKTIKSSRLLDSTYASEPYAGGKTHEGKKDD